MFLEDILKILRRIEDVAERIACSIISGALCPQCQEKKLIGSGSGGRKEGSKANDAGRVCVNVWIFFAVSSSWGEGVGGADDGGSIVRAGIPNKGLGIHSRGKRSRKNKSCNSLKRIKIANL